LSTSSEGETNTMRHSTFRVLGLATMVAMLNAPRPASAAEASFEGSWKWTMQRNGQERTRTLKIKKEGDKLTGKILADEREREVKDLKVEGDQISFQYEIERNGNTTTVKYSGKREGDAIKGTVQFGDTPRPWEARLEAAAAAAPAPAAAKAAPEAAGADGWTQLIHGKTPAESGWKLRKEPSEGHKNGWTLDGGVLKNSAPSIDILTEKTWKDFDLHVEFKVPKGSNSGVYLRGCYEVQVEDTAGKDITKTICGAIYGQQAPSVNAALPAGEWQSFDITLVGNKVTVVHNGKKVVDGFELKENTGGNLGLKHGDPGPIMLQGDHGNVEYRNIKIRPASAAATRL
jgi:hypothetical protein